MIRFHLLFTLIILSLSANAQEAFVEMSGHVSTGDYAPLWLSSNRQGLVSPYSNAAYERVGYKYNFHLKNDTANNWRISAMGDVTLSQNAQTDFAVHQLYGEIGYKKLTLSIGQKEREIDYRNNRLTSGGLSQGINARPIPEVLLDVDLFSVPGLNHWLKLGGRIGFGKTFDGKWQKNWVDTSTGSIYNTDILYHEKVLKWNLGRKDKFPVVFEACLLMMTQFGGTTFNYPSREGRVDIVHSEGFNDYWHAFWPMGSEGETDGVIKNAAGNTVGSYNWTFAYYGKNWKARAYIERMFEDQSMLTLQYGLFDHLIGFDVELPKNPYVSHVVIEHMSTKDQAGPLFHDKTENIHESYTGIDNYYNHSLYSGWQYYGMTIGHPLLTSPIYNDDHRMMFYNNRLRALHIGIDGNPTDELSWRCLATFSRNWGSFMFPLDDVRNEQYFLAEATYTPSRLKGWQATASLGYDHGDLDFLGNSLGAQLTIRKTFDFKKR